jgi:hypothetical protein
VDETGMGRGMWRMVYRRSGGDSRSMGYTDDKVDRIVVRVGPKWLRKLSRVSLVAHERACK